MQNVVAIIPARYGSTRLPGKPLADIGGKPMIRRVYEQAAKSDLVRRVIVATDDERIAAAVRAFGGEVSLTPADIESGTDRCAVVASKLDADIIVNVQGDEPLMPPAVISGAVRPFLQDPGIMMGTVVKPITDPADLGNPAIVKVVLDRRDNALYFSRSAVPFVRDESSIGKWLAGHTFYRHFGLYIYRRDFLLTYTRLKMTPLEKAERLEQLRALEYGYTIHAVVTQEESIAVDTADDLERVRTILKNQQ